ncbi:hypothetical protein C5167_041416 [Papaver somniferum]|nr:hypothetical protein C5167_041416 [Papaver somniferum]
MLLNRNTSKQKRIKHMRSHKKMKAAKSAPSNSSKYAMGITVMFCLDIIVQGPIWLKEIGILLMHMQYSAEESGSSKTRRSYA